jgi:hypothetical protein
MIRTAALVSVVGATLILAACGQPEVATPARDSAEVTATYEAMKAQVLATRRAGSGQAPAVTSESTPVIPQIEPTSTPIPAVTAIPDDAMSIDVMSFFPTNEQLPADFYMWQDEEVSIEEAAASNADPVAHRQRFEDWGFQRLHSRGYELPHSLTITDRMNIFFVTVYAWGSPEQAAAAMAFGVADPPDCHCWTNLEWINNESATIPALGDESAGMTADPVNADGFHLARIWIRFGSVVVRIEAHATTVDPLPEATAFVQSAYGSQ